MTKKILGLLLLPGLLFACSNNKNSSTTSGGSTVISTGSMTSSIIDSYKELPITIDLTSLILSDGWNYITHNEEYPDPDWGTNGFRFTYVGQGIKSPKFRKSSIVKVIVKVESLTPNTRTDGKNSGFEVTALGENDTTIATSPLADLKVGDNEVRIEGADISQIKIMMTGNVGYNVVVDKITIS